MGFNFLLDCQRDFLKGRWHILSEASYIVAGKKVCIKCLNLFKDSLGINFDRNFFCKYCKILLSACSMIFFNSIYYAVTIEGDNLVRPACSKVLLRVKLSQQYL